MRVLRRCTDLCDGGEDAIAAEARLPLDLCADLTCPGGLHHLLGEALPLQHTPSPRVSAESKGRRSRKGRLRVSTCSDLMSRMDSSAWAMSFARWSLSCWIFMDARLPLLPSR